MASLVKSRRVWVVTIAVALVGVSFGYLTSRFWWKKPEDSSVLLSDKRASDKVQNGQAYDKAHLFPGNLKILVVPDDARVEEDGPGGRIDIYMEKSLFYMEHPGVQMSIRDQRKVMGCASRVEGDKIIIATYGEWDDNLEGGSFMKMLFRVPPGLQVESRNGLSGPIIIGPRQPATPARKKVSPGTDGWKTIPDEPDSRQTAKRSHRS